MLLLLLLMVLLLPKHLCIVMELKRRFGFNLKDPPIAWSLTPAISLALPKGVKLPAGCLWALSSNISDAVKVDSVHICGRIRSATTIRLGNPQDTPWLTLFRFFLVLVSDKSGRRMLTEMMRDYEEYHAVGLTSIPFGTSHHVWSPPGLVIANYQLRTALLYDQLSRVDGSNSTVTEEQYHMEMFKLKSIVRTEFARVGFCGAHLFGDTRLSDPKAGNTVLADKKPLRGCGFG